MRVPQNPLLATAFCAVVVGTFLCRDIAARFDTQQTQTEWVAIVLGMILLLIGFSAIDGRMRQLGTAVYPPGPLWLTVGVLPALAVLLFYGGLYLRAYADPPHGLIGGIGLVLSATGILLSLGIAALPRRR